MRDQADTLRRLMQAHLGEGSGPEVSVPGPATRIITVASGKGGVGKTSLVANLGALLARAGQRVLLIDADFGLANLDILFGVHPQVTVDQVLDGTASVQEAVVGIEPNLWLIPSSSGLLGARAWDPASRSKLARIFESCPWDMDVILVDLGAGIQDNVVSVHHPAYHSVVVLTPEPTSMTDAYGLIKILRRDKGVNEVNIIVNQVTDGREGLSVFQRLRDVASRYTDVKLDYLGHCARDEKFLQAVMKRKILLDLDRAASSAPSLELLAKRIQAAILGDPVATWTDSRRTSGAQAPRVPGRFREEPLHITPGITAKFWRTLLGEVKA